jgi:glycosyltransferase involved in cell wall biosynthesis
VTTSDVTGTDVTGAPTTPLLPRPRTGRLVVASVPANHVYVRHLSPEDGSGPVRLPDPPPAEAASTQQWWPPVMLDPAWVEHNDFDVFHLHFGFDARSPNELRELVAALRRRGKPLVFTVHDLRNPHHPDRRDHDRQLDVLVPAADALVTLTPGAAGEIRARWGRDALVVPHPHVVPLEVMRRAAAMREVQRRGPRRREVRIGLHVKSLRAGMHPHAVLPVLVEAVRDLPGAVLQVNGHTDVLDPDGKRYDPALAEALKDHAGRGEVDLRIHDYLDDDGLWAYLASLDVSVLPYRFGTHSGWLEACRDLGTAVVAPSCGYFADQAPVLTYGHDEDHLDAASLVTAVRQAHAGHVAPAPDVEERRAQRARIAAAHARLYESLVGDGR